MKTLPTMVLWLTEIYLDPKSRLKTLCELYLSTDDVTHLERQGRPKSMVITRVGKVFSSRTGHGPKSVSFSFD